jgi:hypothetical protein
MMAMLLVASLRVRLGDGTVGVHSVSMPAEPTPGPPGGAAVTARRRPARRGPQSATQAMPLRPGHARVLDSSDEADGHARASETQLELEAKTCQWKKKRTMAGVGSSDGQPLRRLGANGSAHSA